MKNMIKVSGYSKDGNIEFTNIVLPSKRIVCPRCNGNGKHVNPAIDGHGLSQEDFDRDPDFAEGYFGGRYDVRCEECHGNKVIDIVDEDLIMTKGTPISWRKGLIRYLNAVELEAEARAEREHEYNMGY